MIGLSPECPFLRCKSIYPPSEFEERRNLNVNTLESVRRGAPLHSSLQVSTLSIPRIPLTKSTLSAARRDLLDLMQSVNFGTIETIELRDADPDLERTPRLIRTIKIGARENGPRPEAVKHDFVLMAPVVELFEHFDHIRNGTVTVRVQHGLPTQITVERQL
jgi:hypothetical protein